MKLELRKEKKKRRFVGVAICICNITIAICMLSQMWNTAEEHTQNENGVSLSMSG